MASRSARSRVKEGSLTPAVMTARCTSLRPTVMVSMSTPETRSGGDVVVIDDAVLVGGGTGEVVSPVGVGRGLPSRLVAVLGAHQGFVGRGIGDAGCAIGGHLASEHGDHLGAEQLDLLERGLDREPHAVDIPQLALVVAEAVT